MKRKTRRKKQLEKGRERRKRGKGIRKSSRNRKGD